MTDEIREETKRDLLDANTTDELRAMRDEMQSMIQDWCDEHDVGSPNELRDTITDKIEERQKVNDVQDWELVEYRLDSLTEAIEEVEDEP